MSKFFLMSSLLLSCSRRSVGLQRALTVYRKELFVDYRSSSVALLSTERVQAVMEGNLNSYLTKTSIHRMRKSDLQMHLSYSGLSTKGNRIELISRLMAVLDDQDSIQGVIPPPLFEPNETYVLRVKGHTTQDSSGVGIGLVFYNPSTNNQLWAGRIYASGDRSGFEAEYCAIIIGMDFANAHGIKKLVVQSSNDAIVNQVNEIYRINKPSLKSLFKIEKAHEEAFREFTIQDIPPRENIEAADMARKALATRKSLNIHEDGTWTINDPIEELERQPKKSPQRKEPDDPAHNESIDNSRAYLLRFDGGSRGNPGIAGAGMVLYDDKGQEIWCGWKYHSESATNNVAEYLGLLSGLQCAVSFGIKSLIVEGDSQLIVKQLNGEYRVKDKTLKKYYQASMKIVQDLDYFEIRHIPRAENSRADWLANNAMDLQESHGFDEIPAV